MGPYGGGLTRGKPRFRGVPRLRGQVAARIRWAGAGTRRQVDLEILLGKVGSGRPSEHLGDQGAPSVGKLLAGVTVPIGRIGDGGGYRYAGVPFTLRHQLQRALGIRGVARQHRHRRDELARQVQRRRPQSRPRTPPGPWAHPRRSPRCP